MAGLLDLFSGRSSDIYGQGLLTPEQRGGLGNIGLLALAGKLGQLAGPSFSPVPDFGAALGQAAGAYGASQEGAGTAALNAILTGQKGRKLEQELDYYKQLGPILGKLAGQWPGADGGAGGGEGSGSTGGGAAAPLSAGGGGGGSLTPPAQYADIIRQAAAKENVDPAVLTSLIGHESSFRPDIRGTSGEVGLAQLMPGTAQSLGVTDRTDPTQSIFAAARYLRQGLDAHGGDYTMALRYYNGGPGGVNNPKTIPYANTVLGGASRYGGTAAAAAPAGGGGLPAPTAPNPLSDAEPMVGIPRPKAPAGAGPAAQAGPWAPGNLAQYARPGDRGGPVTVEGVTYPSVSAWNRAMDARATATADWAATPAATSGGGGLLAPPPGAGTDSYVTPQGPAGDVGPAGPAGPATPRAPLPTMGPAGIELPPMQGPLATPAPAAAAPAAPGPGLLSPPGALPAAPALPRVNPAFDAWLRNAAAAAGLVKGAGLPDAISPLIDALKASPSFQAQLEIARKSAGLPFIGPETTAKKAAEEPFDIRASERALGNALTEKGWRLDANGQAVRIPGYDKMEEATAFANAKGKGEGELQTTLIIKSVENQNKIIADAAQNGNQVTFDKDGKMSVSRLPGADAAAAASAAATTGAQEQAKADVAAGTAPDIARRTKYAEGVAAQDTAARAQAIAARNTLPLLDDAKEQLTGAGIFSGPRANLDMTLAQVASAAGWPSDKLVNTQTYIQQAGARAAEILRSGAYGTGSGISQNDLRAADKLANGDITLDIRTIKRIMDLAERKAARDIDNFNAIANKRDPGSAVEHPPRWTGRYTSDGKRIDKMPDGSLQVKE